MDADSRPPPGSGRPQPDGAAATAAPVGQKRKATAEPQRPDGEANAHCQADAASSSVAADSSADSAASATDDVSLSLSQSATATSDSSQQTEQPAPAHVPDPLTACAADADSPSAAVRLADAAADSATAATANSAAVTVPMLHYMAKCRDVQFVLMKLLSLKDLAALNSACHSWRQWLLHPPLIDGLQFEFEAPAFAITPLASCKWARRLVAAVHLPVWRGAGSPSLLGIASAEVELAACDELLTALPRFTRLHTLQLAMCETFTRTTLWSMCFTALSGSLRELQLHGLGTHQTVPVNAALAHVGRLRQLTSVLIVMSNPHAAREVDLSQLPSLPSLRRFQLCAQDEQGNKLWFRCTPQQVQHLARCSRLTHLDCSSIWSPDERELDDDDWQLPPAAQQIEEGIAALVRGLTLQPADAAAAGASESASSAAPPTSAAAPSCLRFLNLRGTAMSATVWEHVSRLTEQTELVPKCWGSDMTPQLWARLAHFKRLGMVTIVWDLPDDLSSTPLRTEHFLRPLLQCAQLEIVIINCGLSMDAAQLDGIARLPRLHTLGLHSVEVESVDPLARAAKLRILLLALCRGPPAVVDFRSSLPPLPALLELRLEDRDRITAAQAAPLNAALFARMPKLTSANFHQNLLA